MKKATRDLGEIERRVRHFRDERDWKQFHTPKDLAISLSIEAAELLEHFQWKSEAETARDLADPARRREIAKEMADVLILLVSAADVMGVDLHAAALSKIAENARKYPVAKAKGRATKYDQL